METMSQKFMEAMHQLWPYVSGIFITIIAIIKLWWSDRNKTQHRIANVEKIAEHAITEKRLQECKVDVLGHDVTVEERILLELKIIAEETKELREDMREDNKTNAQAHQDIMNTMMRIHNGD